MRACGCEDVSVNDIEGERKRERKSYFHYNKSGSLNSSPKLTMNHSIVLFYFLSDIECFITSILSFFCNDVDTVNLHYSANKQ